MPRQVFLFDPPDRFVAGTVGQPGERAFYLQASAAGRTVSVALEKTQVAVLAERLDQLLDQVARRAPEVGVPPAASVAVDDAAPLEMPVAEEFRVGTMALAWDGADARVVIEALAVVAGEEEGPDPSTDDDKDGPAVLRVRVAPGAARAFVRRAQRLVAAGRPPCPFCGLPLDPQGHLCPRQNGHRH